LPSIRDVPAIPLQGLPEGWNNGSIMGTNGWNATTTENCEGFAPTKEFERAHKKLSRA